jgi:lipoprotein LprG
MSLLTAAFLALAGCSHDTPAANLPNGASLLAQASTAMSSVQSAHLVIDSTGKVGSIILRTAEGDLTKGGDAKGSIKLLALGQVVQLDFVVISGSFYIKGLTGGWQRASAADVATFYDPSGILDPNRGIVKLLSTATGANTEDTETVNGVNTYRVAVNLDPTAVAAIVPGTPKGTVSKIWLDQSTKRLVKAELDVPESAGGPGSVTVRLTDLDKPVTINAPI